MESSVLGSANTRAPVFELKLVTVVASEFGPDLDPGSAHPSYRFALVLRGTGNHVQTAGVNGM